MRVSRLMKNLKWHLGTRKVIAVTPHGTYTFDIVDVTLTDEQVVLKLREVVKS
jgi:hypothetical protein